MRCVKNTELTAIITDTEKVISTAGVPTICTGTHISMDLETIIRQDKKDVVVFPNDIALHVPLFENDDSNYTNQLIYLIKDGPDHLGAIILASKTNQHIGATELQIVKTAADFIGFLSH